MSWAARVLQWRIQRDDLAERLGESCENLSWLGSEVVIFLREPGMPSKRGSQTRVDYVPALCTHRPSLLPIECIGEFFRARYSKQFECMCEVARAAAFRGSKSRNKVSVGEPADGSLPMGLCHFIVVWL